MLSFCASWYLLGLQTGKQTTYFITSSCLLVFFNLSSIFSVFVRSSIPPARRIEYNGWNERKSMEVSRIHTSSWQCVCYILLHCAETATQSKSKAFTIHSFIHFAVLMLAWPEAPATTSPTHTHTPRCALPKKKLVGNFKHIIHSKCFSSSSKRKQIIATTADHWQDIWPF